MPLHTLAIFGITGQTGHALAEAAIERGWSVRGLARAKGGDIPGATIIRGSFLEADRVAETLDGADAVCCVVGPRPPYTDVFCADATAAILAAMRRGGVRRIVCQTGAMIGSGNRTLPFGFFSALAAHRLPTVDHDRLEQERLIMESGLAWTLIKPPRLTNVPGRRPIQAGPELRMGLLASIGRMSLARFVLDVIDRGEFVGERVFVRE